MFFTSLRGNQYAYDLLRNKIYSVTAAHVTDLCLEEATKGVIKLPFDTEMLKRLATEDVSYLSITITEVCNMRCKYCTYSGGFEGHRRHTKQSMTYQEGTKVIDWLQRHSRKAKELRIGFYGGEVLTNFHVLQALTAYAQDKFGDRLKDVLFTTNGTLLNDNIVDWIAQNPILSVSVTLNGPAEIHDRNRVTAVGEQTHNEIYGRIEKLAVRLGKNFGKQVSFLANFKDFRERDAILRYFEQNEVLNKSSVICTPIEYPLSMSERIERDSTSVADNLFRLAQETAAIRKCSSDTIETFGARLAKAGIKPDMLIRFHKRQEGIADNLYFKGGCIPFANRLAVDLKGDLHFCEATDFLFPIGNVFRDEIYEESLDKLQQIEILMNGDLKCRNCPAVNFCAMCFRDFLDRDGVKQTIEIKDKCLEMRKKFMHDISIYVSILEEYPEFLDSLLPDQHNERTRTLIHDAIKRKGE